MRHTILVAAAICFISALGGCGRSTPTTDTFPSWAKGTVDGVSCEVRGERNSSSLMGEGFHEFTAGKNKLRLQGGRITSDGKDYGEVKAGDSVIVEPDGTVFVNGTKR
jgi:hypothetical protein